MERLISVIIPCYNVEKYIDRCLDSLTMQTIGMDRLEIILVDDASTDQTLLHLEAFEQRYPENVMLIPLEQNGRQGRARNIGLQYATCPYVTFVDSDDWLEADCLERLYEPMKVRDFDIVSCNFWRDRDDGHPIEVAQTKNFDKDILIDSDDKRGTLLMCMSMGLTVWGKLYQRSFLESHDIYFLEGCAYEDRFTIVMMYLELGRVMVIDYTGYHYFVNEQSTVLQKGAEYHSQLLDVDEATWQECAKRGYLTRVRSELECYFLLLGYIGALKLFSFRYDEIPYELYQRLREDTIRRIPDYQVNPYIKEYATEFNYGVLETLTTLLSPEELNTLATAIRRKFS